MAYVPIILNKLKYTYNGNDYDLQPVQIAYINNLVGTYAGSPYNFKNWLASNAETTNNFNITGHNNDAQGIENRDKIIASLNASALNIYPIFQALSVGSDLYFWREDVGRNVRWVWRKNDATHWKTGVYAYGTYTWGNTKGVPNISYGRWATGIQNIGFLYNESNGRFHWWENRYYSNDSAHGYNSNPVYFSASCDYYWSAYGAVLTILCTGNIYNPPTPTTDPYAPAGPSTTTPSSTGTFDAESDAIALPSTPTLSAQSSGLISLYVIDTANMATFANFLLSGSFNDATLKKLFTSPMEAILCLNYFPYTPPKALNATEISIGKAATGANGYLLTGQYDTVSCGTVDLDEYYGSCLDMSPYTTVTLVLPYCGAVDLDPDEFMGKTIGVTYKIDCYTGACLALVTADDNVMMQVQGMVSNPMPIMASNYSSIVSGIASTAIAALGTLIAVGTGGVGTPAAIAMAGGVAAVGANSVMNAKIHYNHGGSGGMGTGLFGVQKPYLIVKRPRACVPDNNGNFQGYPSFVSLVLGNCQGFTKVNEIHLDTITATDAEKKELESILKGGVWF